MSFPDYTFSGRFATIRGNRLHYLDEGAPDAPILLMLHGNPTWSFHFRHLVTAFRNTHRCIVPDHVGMGLSDRPGPGSYAHTLADRVDDLDALVEQTAPGREITLVLHDWGGMIGMAWACRHPERVRRIVLMNTAAFLPPPDWHVPWQLRVARMPVLGPLLVQGFNAFCRGAARGCVTRAPLPESVRAAYLAPYGNWHDRYAVLRFVQDIPLAPSDPAHAIVERVQHELPRFADRPVLICWGLRDFIFDPVFLAGWVERFPRAEVHRFADAGHYLLEDAGPEAIGLVRDFLARHAL